MKRRLRRFRANLRRLALPRGWLRRTFLRLAWAGLSVLMLYFVITFVAKSLELSRLDHQKAERQDQNTALALEIEQLQGELDYVESDAYVERAAREQLGMAREGETVVIPQIIAKEPTPQASPSPQPVQPPESAPNWKRWINSLSGRY